MPRARRTHRFRGASDVRGFGAFDPATVGLGFLALLALLIKRPAQVQEQVATVLNTLPPIPLVGSLTGLVTQPLWAKGLYDVLTLEFPTMPGTGRLTMVAHAAYESGWGKSAAAKAANNFWNITSGGSWSGPVLVEPNSDRSYSVTECARLGRDMTTQSNGKLACRIDQTWRRYPTVNAAVRDYWQFLNRYPGAKQALTVGDVAAFAQQLGAGGYYTLPVEEYTRTLVAVAATAKRFIGV